MSWLRSDENCHKLTHGGLIQHGTTENKEGHWPQCRLLKAVWMTQNNVGNQKQCRHPKNPCGKQKAVGHWNSTTSGPWRKWKVWCACLLVACLTSQQQASVSQGQICSDNFTCCHTEIEVADPTFYLTQSQYTDTGPTSPSADPIKTGAWQGSHWSANFWVIGMTRPKKKIPAQARFKPGIFWSRDRRLNH